MSYDYYLHAFMNKEPQQVSTKRIIEVFMPFISDLRDESIDVTFDEENSCTIFINSTQLSSSEICIHRPCATEEFIRCIYATMLLGNFVFFEPDGNSSIVTNPETVHHMPEDMIEGLGKPFLSYSWDDFLIAVRNNRD